MTVALSPATEYRVRLETKRMQLEVNLRRVIEQATAVVAAENAMRRRAGPRPTSLFATNGPAWREFDRNIVSTYGRTLHVAMGTLGRYQSLARGVGNYRFSESDAARVRNDITKGNQAVRTLQRLYDAYAAGPWAAYDPEIGGPTAALFQTVAPESVVRATIGVTGRTVAETGARQAERVVETAEAIAPGMERLRRELLDPEDKGGITLDWKDWLAIIGGVTVGGIALITVAKVRGITPAGIVEGAARRYRD